MMKKVLLFRNYYKENSKHAKLTIALQPQSDKRISRSSHLSNTNAGYRQQVRQKKQAIARHCVFMWY